MMMITKGQDTKAEIQFSSHSSHTLRDSWKLWQIIGERLERIEYICRILENRTEQGTWLLDAGSGHGAYSKLLGQKGYEVVGTDVSKVHMQNANSTFAMKNVSFLVGDLLEIPFKQGAFQVCFCSQFLHHFRNIEGIIDELSRVIQRKGELLVYEPNGSNIVYRLTEIGKKIAPRRFLHIVGIDTVNETIHSWRSYIRFLKAKKFKHTKVMFFNSSEQEASLKGKTITTILHTYGFTFGIIFSIRFLLFKMVSKIPNQQLGCGQLVIYSRKD